MKAAADCFALLLDVCNPSELERVLRCLGDDADHEPTFGFWDVPGLHFGRVAVLPGGADRGRLLIAAAGDGQGLFESWLQRAGTSVMALIGPFLLGDTERRDPASVLAAACLPYPNTFYTGIPGQSVQQIRQEDVAFCALRATAQRCSGTPEQVHAQLRDHAIPIARRRRSLTALFALPGAWPPPRAGQAGAWAHFMLSSALSIVGDLLQRLGLPRLPNPPLRTAERTERATPSARPDDEHLADLLSAEDHQAQNGFTFYAPTKPSVFRRLRLRWALGMSHWFAQHWFVYGKLAGVGSIHFARIHALQDGEHMLFMSDYDGSWEAYLSDFIHVGSFAVVNSFANMLGSPPTLDGVPEPGFANHFLPFVRRYQVRNALWYSAYRKLTMAERLRNRRVQVLLGKRPGRAASAELLRLLT